MFIFDLAADYFDSATQYLYSSTEEKEKCLKDQCLQRSSELRQLCLDGLPKESRKEIWFLLIGNSLDITHDLYQDLLVSGLSQVDFCIHNEKLKKANASGANTSTPKNSNSFIHEARNKRKINSFGDKRITRNKIGKTESFNRGRNDGERSSGHRNDQANNNKDNLKKNRNKSNNNTAKGSTYKALENKNSGERNANGNNGKQHSINTIDVEEENDTVEDKPFAALNYRQIALDLPRTKQNLSEEQKNKIRNVLLAYCLYRPDLGYVQGMAFVVDLLQSELVESYETFVALTNLMNRDIINSLYTLKPSQIWLLFEIYQNMFEDCLPRYAQVFQELQITADMYIIRWIMTLFTNCVPLNVTKRIWDRLFFFGDFYVFKVAVALVGSISNEIIASKNLDKIVQALSSPFNSYEDEEDFFLTLDSLDVSEIDYDQYLTDAKHRLESQQENGNNVMPLPLNAKEDEITLPEIWDLCDGRVVRTIKGHSDICYQLEADGTNDT